MNHTAIQYCEKCNHTGRFPLKRKDGSIVPYAWTFCECNEYSKEQPDHFQRLTPDDIDYPVSYSHYRALCQYHGWTDQGNDQPDDEQDAPEPIRRPVIVDTRPLTDYEQLRGQVNFLTNKVAELRARKSKKDNL